MLRFETDPLGMPAGPGIGGEPAEPVAPEPEPFQISQEDWERSQQGQSYLINRLEEIARIGEQPQDPRGFTLPEDSLLSESDLQVFNQMIEQRLAPFQETSNRWMQSEGEELALDVISDDAAQNGDFIFDGSKQKARDLSENYYPQFAARYGAGAQAAEAAIRQACADTRDWEKQVGQAFMEREQNQLSTLAGAPRSPTQPGRPAQQLTTVEGGDEFNVLAKYFPRNT